MHDCSCIGSVVPLVSGVVNLLPCFIGDEEVGDLNGNTRVVFLVKVQKGVLLVFGEEFKVL